MDIIATSVLASLLSLLLLRKVASRLGLVDRPGGRKQHAGEVPVIGGLAAFFGMAIAVAMHGLLAEIPPVLLFGGAVVVVTGALDDRFGLSVRLRLSIHISVVLCTAIAMASPLSSIDGIIGGRLELGVLAWPITVFVAVGVCNAYNLMDGMDGLAAGMAVVALVAIGMYDGLLQLSGAKGLFVLFVTALLPFLFFNLGGGGSTNRVFLGDAGSVLIGYLVICSLLESCQEPESGMSTSDALWICALPIYDTLAVMMQRVAQGASPFSPDRKHIHHLLLAVGLSKAWALVSLIGVALLLALVGYAAGGVGAGFSLALFGMMFVTYGVVRYWCWRHIPQLSARQMVRQG